MTEYLKSTGGHGLFVAALVVGLAAGAWGQSSLPEGKGKDVVEKACTACHGTSLFTGNRFSKSDWEYVVNDMIDRGALITAAEVPIIVDYLTEHFGPEEKPAGGASNGQGAGRNTEVERPAAALLPGAAKIAGKKHSIPF